jgi:hypothetical protein
MPESPEVIYDLARVDFETPGKRHFQLASIWIRHGDTRLCH